MEGNAWQSSWHVLQDPEGLVAAHGGREKFGERLKGLFDAPETDYSSSGYQDITWTIGQYAHGNEPSHHAIYLFPYAGRPDLAARYVREVFDRFYIDGPEGVCGNEDCGQISAWYLFSAAGFYPFNPCDGDYVIGAPQFPRLTFNLPEGRTFTVVANGISRENKYVRSATLNGRPLDGFIVRHADIMAGGELVFEMAPCP